MLYSGRITRNGTMHAARCTVRGAQFDYAAGCTCEIVTMTVHIATPHATASMGRKVSQAAETTCVFNVCVVCVQ